MTLTLRITTLNLLPFILLRMRGAWGVATNLTALVLKYSISGIPSLFPTSPLNYPFIKPRSVWSFFYRLTMVISIPASLLYVSLSPWFFFFFLIFISYWVLVLLAIFSILFSRCNLCSCLQFSDVEQMSPLKLKYYSSSDQLHISESFKLTENNVIAKDLAFLKNG